MSHTRFPRSFYTRDTLTVAKDLLGKYIIRKVGGKILSGQITETEAYIGPYDKASHAYKGKRTPRNEAEFLTGGHIYIYLVYGMYWQFNITTSGAERPECVLIRALDAGPETRGPGKLCNYLKLDKSFYGEDLTSSKRIWLAASMESRPASPKRRRGERASPKGREDRGVNTRPSHIKATARIGIGYAGPHWAKRKWRFIIRK